MPDPWIGFAKIVPLVTFPNLSLGHPKFKSPRITSLQKIQGYGRIPTTVSLQLLQV